MASFRRKKEALRAVTYAFVAGTHYIYSEANRSLALRAEMGLAPIDAAGAKQLQEDYASVFSSPLALDMFVEHLNEEGLYPFRSDWSRDAIGDLLGKLIAPSIVLPANEIEGIRFKKGYKDLLNAYAESLESSGRNDELLDHWLTLLFNASFFAAMSVAARNSSAPKLFYAALTEIETEIEPWSHYDQLVNVLDRQLRRETKRNSGLVTELEYDQ